MKFWMVIFCVAFLFTACKPMAATSGLADYGGTFSNLQTANGQVGPEVFEGKPAVALIVDANEWLDPPGYIRDVPLLQAERYDLNPRLKTSVESRLGALQGAISGLNNGTGTGRPMVQAAQQGVQGMVQTDQAKAEQVVNGTADLAPHIAVVANPENLANRYTSQVGRNTFLGRELRNPRRDARRRAKIGGYVDQAVDGSIGQQDQMFSGALDEGTKKVNDALGFDSGRGLNADGRVTYGQSNSDGFLDRMNVSRQGTWAVVVNPDGSTVGEPVRINPDQLNEEGLKNVSQQVGANLQQADWSQARGQVQEQQQPAAGSAATPATGVPIVSD